MAMNQYRRKVKINQPDCFKPWETQRNNSCSPQRNSKRPSDMYRVAFADFNHDRRHFPPIRNDSLHTVFVSHLQKQLPKLANQSQFNTMHKQRKDNQNLNTKHTCANDICKNLTENEIKHPTFRHNRRCNRNNSVYFEDSNTCNKFQSASETDMSSNLNSTVCRNRSVKNVINKFNRLCNEDSQKHLVPKQTDREVKNDTSLKNQMKLQRKEDSISLKIVTGNRNEDNKAYKKNIKSPKSPQNIESGTQLRSRRLKITNIKEYPKEAYCDNLLDIFKPKDNKKEEMIEIIPLMPKKSVVNFQELETEKNAKEFVSSQTQTTPCPSATNIMINVYNTKSPRLVHQRILQQNPIEIKISQDIEKNTTLSISQEQELCERKDIEISKKSVKYCIEKFEENLRKKGVRTEKDVNSTKIFSKIPSNYLLKKKSTTILSTRAKSVHF